MTSTAVPTLKEIASDERIPLVIFYFFGFVTCYLMVRVGWIG